MVEVSYKKENRELGTSLELHRVRPTGTQQLIKFFGRFRQHTIEITGFTIIPVVKRVLRLIYPL